MKVRLGRRYRFEAAHRLVASSLSDEENWRIYGKCSRPGGHGHNYEVDVCLEGEIDPVTGLLVRRDELDAIVREKLVDRCDHRNLNDLIDEVTTGENLARIFFDWLDPALRPLATLRRVRVYETARNVFDARSE